MLKHFFRTGALCVTLALAGCANLPSTGDRQNVADPDTAATEPAEKRGPITPLSPELMYQIMVGEIAGQRSRLPSAARHYLAAARATDDPAVAKRALRIAVFGKQLDLAYQAARRWVALEPDNGEAHKALAVLASKAGKREETIDHLVSMLERAESQQDAYETITTMLAGEADKRTGIEVMDQLLTRVPVSPEALLTYARLAANAGESELALQKLGAALDLRPGWPPAENLRARILAGMNKRQQARTSLEAALRRNPDSEGLRMTYARLLVDMGETNAARKQFRRVIRKSPKNADAVYALALTDLKARDLDHARKGFERMLELGKREAESNFYLGNIAVEQSQWLAARRHYLKVPQGDYWLQARARLARMMAKEGKLDAAREELKDLRLKYPKLAVRLASVEGELLMEAGEYQQAYDLYSQHLESEPDNNDLLYMRALAAERLDLLDNAEQDLRAILAREPENVPALNALGYTLADRTDRLDEALKLVTRALEKRPDDPAILDSMGWVHFRLGNHAKAETYLRRAWDQTGDGEIGAHLGEVLWVSGQHDAARAVWRKSHEKHPDNPVLNRVMKRYQP